MSLRGLINARIVLSVVLILIIGGVMAIWQARQSVQKEINSSFNLALEMLELSFSYPDNRMVIEDHWMRQLSAIQKTRHIHISLVNDDGSESEWLSGNDLSEQEEPPVWFKMAVTSDYPSASYDIRLLNGSTKTLLIRADPIDEVAEAWSESLAFFWSIVLMMMVIFIAINIVFHSMLRTVHAILTGLRRVESGEYGKKLPRFKISEFDAIAAEVNNLSEALDTARQNNQALARHTMHIQENERQTMSRELHDEMGQSLTAVKAMAVATKQPQAKINEISDSIIGICNHLSVVVRSMMRTLHPLSLADLGLAATLTDLVSEWQRRHPTLKIELNYDEAVDWLNEEVAIHVYRVVQECLTNVVRHSEATQAMVVVRRHLIKGRNQVVIRVEDNGIGGSTEGEGFGVLGMRERVESMGGQFVFESNGNLGVRVRAWMPFIERVND
ncbi:sensor histidine kinase [Methylophaga thiooxydans]|uniref:ATPase, histidine kinase-, DNA gyrase B-, and HSP90-like domain protein n=1 Tax=Methylophaga thiooxydans DMS010 TaxID=637616 RepID=C0N7V6_9GAMM|nr:sensor histidine kinase [Methylophaga thiooxydans]EEF79193.1 ATPase, histidine kinase-, DNA gyrase B-, and HSP90-like domain protein [Methylophaga thiooxydans DMS010]